MMQKSLILAATAATFATAFVAVPSNAEARAHHRIYNQFYGYGFAPSYAPRYGYAPSYRYYDRFGSNLNPDRQMVGQGE
jgi:hypothetical protein